MELQDSIPRYGTFEVKFILFFIPHEFLGWTEPQLHKRRKVPNAFFSLSIFVLSQKKLTLFVWILPLLVYTSLAVLFP